MAYTVEIKQTAVREVLDLVSEAPEIPKVIISLGKEPRPMGNKKMVGMERTYRVRVGNYRILYEVDDRAKLVTVIKVGNRRDVYD